MKKKKLLSPMEVLADPFILGSAAPEFSELPVRPIQTLPDGVEWIRDMDCTKETPLIHGFREKPIYGNGIKIRPRLEGRRDSAHFEKIFLDELLPLEDYDLFVVLFSGGKDSLACYLRLLELGVPKEKIELWHHDIDGGHPTRRMDWPCTSNYVKAVAQAEGVTLRISYRVNGFFGELYRVGASEPIEWIDPDTGEVRRCKPSTKYLQCQEIKDAMAEHPDEETQELLKQFGYRMKFPAKSGDLSRRWCSSTLKMEVMSSVVSNLDSLQELEAIGGKRMKFPAKGTPHQGRWCSDVLKNSVQQSVTSNLAETRSDKKILVVSGERRGESPGRSKYNEIEVHRTNAEAKAHRLVHQWRCCIDYTEKDVWEIIKRHKINPHPCYRVGWNRCSCAMCVFSTPKLFAGYKELFPEEFAELHNDELRLNFTLDNKKDLYSFIDGAESCVVRTDQKALNSIMTGEYSVEDVYTDTWEYPAGAFHGGDGGSC
jgi:3'-phosphoadenosine 5'-phosphosulfate sulfotransferase (PAPS reductase)/FAD synthetase